MVPTCVTRAPARADCLRPCAFMRALCPSVVLGLLFVLVSSAQGAPIGGQLGGQARADAAQSMIVLAVEQGIAALPPPSGQAYSYEYDPARDTYVRSQRLGPTAFRATESVGTGHFNLRLAASYFDLNGSFGPIPYEIASSSEKPLYGDLGLRAQAHVEITNLSATYGVGARFDLNFNLPIVIVDAQAWQTFSTLASELHEPLSQVAASGAPSLADLKAELQPGGLLAIRTAKLSSLGFSFNDGTHVGVGRISVGAKGVAYAAQRLQLALTTELLMPSPSQSQFSGSDSTAIFPGAVAAVPLLPYLKLRMDAGYNYDFNVAELRSFVWDAGASVPLQRASFDIGVRGSEYNKKLQWTPPVAYGVPSGGFPATVLTAQNGTSLGDSFVDLIYGSRIRITNRLVLSGAVDVPLNNEGFRPVAVGTVAVESYF